jgi:hypothetical protein
MMATIVAMVFTSCKKTVDVTPGIVVSFKPDPSVSSQLVQPAVNNQLLFTGIFNTGSINGFSLTNVTVTLKRGGDAALPQTYLRQSYCTIDGGVTQLKIEKKDSITTSEFSFPNIVHNIAQYQTRTIRIYGDILSSATNNTGAEDNLILSVRLTYTGFDGTRTEYFQTESIDGQKIIFSGTPVSPLFSVTSIADPSTPVSSTILDGQEKPVLQYGVRLNGVSGTVIEHRFLVQGPAANAVTSIKLFSGTTFITQAPVVLGAVLISTTDVVSAGIQKNYSVSAVISVGSGDVSNNDFTITLDAVTARSTANEQKSDPTDRVGNPFTVLKAILDIKKVAVPTLFITNGPMDLYTVDLTAVNGDVSLKEFTYDIFLNDQGINDTLSLKSFQILNGGGVDITNQFRFTDAASTVDSLFSESDSKLRTTRISGTGETVIPAGTTLRLKFRAVVGGFNHPADGDGFSVIPITDGTASTGLKYLNSGGISNGNAKLYSSAASSTSAMNFYLIWSDYASPNHNGLFIQTSNDWIGGDRVTKTLSVNNFHQ